MGKRGNMFIGIVGGFIILVSLFVFHGCSKNAPGNEINESSTNNASMVAAPQTETTLTEPVDVPMPEITTNLQIYNLQKLCKVWGYVKYTHPAFLLGQKDWDEELLKLMPQIALAENEEDVNGILYDWYIGLGKSDYETLNRVPEWVGAKEENKIVQAETSWLSDKTYLGEPLSNALTQIQPLPNVNREKAPVNFDSLGKSIFPNEKTYITMDYADDKYRLLGLFRLWNAMEYYFPYMDILDDDWNELLAASISDMLKGDYKQSYELTLAALSAKLHDAHVYFKDETFSYIEFGRYLVPVKLTEAEGRLVVSEVKNDDCPLMPGDVLLKLNGVSIEEIIEQRTNYLSVNEEEKLLKISPLLLLSKHEKIDITVLRVDKEETFQVSCVSSTYSEKSENSHELLQHNIGLMNPSKLAKGEIHQIMKEFMDTDGLIIDLRQYPSDFITYDLAGYLVDKIKPFASFSRPSRAVPGTFLRFGSEWSGGIESGSLCYFYDKKVVVLMDQNSMSQAEYTIMSVRNGPNVTVMGENSIGSEVDVTFLPLPGGMEMSFTGLGVYTPEGGQTQRIGLSPDIYIERTIAGVREERDEYIEAAVQYILEKNAEKQ